MVLCCVFFLLTKKTKNSLKQAYAHLNNKKTKKKHTHCYNNSLQTFSYLFHVLCNNVAPASRFISHNCTHTRICMACHSTQRNYDCFFFFFFRVCKFQHFRSFSFRYHLKNKCVRVCVCISGVINAHCIPNRLLSSSI